MTQTPSDKAQAQQAVDTFKLANASALKAVAGHPELEVSYTATERLELPQRLPADKTVRLPYPALQLDAAQKQLLRGAADVKALRLRHHNAPEHARNAPSSSEAKAAFDALEMARCEGLGSRDYQGIAGNLRAVTEERLSKMGFETVRKREDAQLPEVLYNLAKARIGNEPVPSGLKPLLAQWEPWLEARLGKGGFDKLAQAAGDQHAFAALSQSLLQKLDLWPAEITPAPPTEETAEAEQHDQGSNASDEQDAGDSGEMAKDSQDGGEEAEQDQQQDSGDIAQVQAGEDPGDTPAEAAEETPLPPGTATEDGPSTNYKIYTTGFDEEVAAEDLAPDDELIRLRSTLDHQLSQMQAFITRLANRLQRQLLARQQRSWLFDQEEGYLDPARLARVVADPSYSLSYKREKDIEFRDTVVCLLLDNSGSMRGRPITIAALCADILARTLERCQVKVEILGFTTKQWKGGKSRELWLTNGRPPLPGRLNDLRHIIYKDADTPYRRVRKNLGLMLKEGLLKENIDGEALVWAHNRLAKRPEQRKILMVISDGAPVDDSTLSANHSTLLEQDLRDVIHFVETRSPVTLTAIGIGHDVTRYYKRALTITDAAELGPALINRLAELFAEK
jgi:cobaltochelatase CobT